MTYVLLTIFILTKLIYYLIIIDIILSWLSLLGLNLRVEFIKSILDPIYERIKNTIPTNIGIFELSPIILVLILVFIQGIIVSYDSNILINYNNFIRF